MAQFGRTASRAERPAETALRPALRLDSQRAVRIALCVLLAGLALLLLPSGWGEARAAVLTAPDQPSQSNPVESATNVAISNPGQNSTSDYQMDISNQQYATSFTTGTDRFVLARVNLRMRRHATRPSTVFTVSIHQNVPAGTVSVDTPATTGQTLTALNQTSVAGVYRIFGFISSAGVYLTPNTKYWVLVSSTGILDQFRSDTSNSEDSGRQTGWSIGNLIISCGASFGDSCSHQITTPVFPMGIIAEQMVTLTSAEVLSTPLEGDTYHAGEYLEVRFHFDGRAIYKKRVAAFWFDGEYRSAHYLQDRERYFPDEITTSEGGKFTTLIYIYRVRGGDTDADGFSLGGGGLRQDSEDPDHRIVDRYGFPVWLQTDGFDAGAAHKVDGSEVSCEDLLCASLTPNIRILGSRVLYAGCEDRYYNAGFGALSNRTISFSGQPLLGLRLVQYDHRFGRLDIVTVRKPTEDFVKSAVLVIGNQAHHWNRARYNFTDGFTGISTAKYYPEEWHNLPDWYVDAPNRRQRRQGPVYNQG